MSCGWPKCALIPPAESLELDDLRVGQSLVVLAPGLEPPFTGAAASHGNDHELLRRDVLVDDRAIAHAIRVGAHEAGDQRFAPTRSSRRSTTPCDST